MGLNDSAHRVPHTANARLAIHLARSTIYPAMKDLCARLSVAAMFLLPCLGADKLPVTLTTSGGGCCFQVDDKLTIAPDGSVEYFAATPNYVELKLELPGMGEYAARVAPSLYDSIAQLAREYIKADDHSPIPPDALVQTVHFEETKERRAWVCCQAAASLNSAFAKLRAAAIQHPIRVLTLECDQSAKQLNCRYNNIGTKVVTTVDPINVASIACGPQSLGVPRATPKVIQIQPGGFYSFVLGADELLSNRACETIWIDSRMAKVPQEAVMLVELRAKIRAGGK